MTTTSISVIIPTVQPDDALMALLGQLDGMDIFEVIIVRTEGTPIPFKLGESRWLTAPKGRGSQIQTGLEAAQGTILWILHADSIVPEDAVSEITRITQDPLTAMGCFPLKFNFPNISLKLFAMFSKLPTQLTTFGDQGFFFHRKYKSYMPDLTPYPLLEDVVLYRALRQKGRIVKAQHPIITDASRFRKHGVWRTQWHNIVTLWKFRKGVSAQNLYQAYYL